MKNSALLVTALSLSACSAQIPNVKSCIEIPFLDGAEGACVETITRKTSLLSAAEWAKVRPTMVMLPSESWSEIKKAWLTQCRYQGDSCNLAVQSVDTAFKKLDEILKRLLPKL